MVEPCVGRCVRLRCTLGMRLSMQRDPEKQASVSAGTTDTRRDHSEGQWLTRRQPTVCRIADSSGQGEMRGWQLRRRVS